MADYKLPIITGTELTAGDLLRWDGSDWVNYAESVYQPLGDVATENVHIGSGTSHGDAAQDNVFIGYRAGYNNDDSRPLGNDADGKDNVYIGHKAGYGETAETDNSGGENVAVGSFALRCNTTGYENTAVGDDTLQFNTTGHGNTALGNDALQGVSGHPITGNFNTALGCDTLYVLNSGDYNTAVGYQSLYSNTSESFNTAFGYQAGKLSTNSYIIAIGYQAGENNIKDYSAMFGYQAGQYNKGFAQAAYGFRAGRYNTGLGQMALGNYVGEYNTGEYQTAIGRYAGVYNEGNRNTAIGSFAWNSFVEDSGNAVTFDFGDVDVVNNRVTVTAHGLGANDVYLNLKFDEGDAALPEIADASYHQWQIIDEDTLELITDTITGQGTGEGHTLTPQEVYTNTTAIGYNAEPDASNQVLLGDTSVTQIKSTGNLYISGSNDNYINGNVGIKNASPSVELDVTGQAKFTSPTFPVIDAYRDTTTAGQAIFAGAKLERLMTGGTALDGSGISFYFKSPDDAGNSTYAGLCGGGLYDVSNGAEKSFIAISPCWLGADPTNQQALKVYAVGSSVYNNTVTVNVQNAAVVKSGTSLQVESIVSNAHIIRINTKLLGANDLAGLSFGVHTNDTDRVSKSAIVHQRKGSWGQGDLVFLVDANTDQADVAIGDEVMRMTSSGMLVMPDGGTIGQAAGPLLTFDDTNNYLEITGCKVGIGTATPVTQATIEGTLTLKEQAAADVDTEAYGQLWVKSDAPNVLMFTDDVGTDFIVDVTPV